MNYRDVADLFAAEFSRRAGATARLFDLVWLREDGRRADPGGDPTTDLAALVIIGELQATTEAEAALAPTLHELILAEPCAAYADAPTVYGQGEPVAFLFEQTAGVVLEVREQCPEYQAQGAVALALGWVW